VDGARLGYGLTAKGNDVGLSDLARLCDVFYIGGTKCGAMFGEAVVIANKAIAEDFRYIIKQRGGMLAKGFLLGAQFDALMSDGLYFEITRKANAQADRIRETLTERNVPLFVLGVTNQVFPILPDAVLTELGKEFTFSEIQRYDENRRVVRFCTSWATTDENVEALCDALRKSL
jgi:threonine aldolase